jgi:hypothetical protein
MAQIKDILVLHKLRIFHVHILIQTQIEGTRVIGL